MLRNGIGRGGEERLYSEEDVEAMREIRLEIPSLEMMMVVRESMKESMKRNGVDADMMGSDEEATEAAEV